MIRYDLPIYCLVFMQSGVGGKRLIVRTDMTKEAAGALLDLLPRGKGWIPFVGVL